MKTRFTLITCLAIVWVAFFLTVSANGDFDWPDRRPIGAMFLAASGQNWPKNPRGYFNDRNLDVSTKEGQSELRHRMMEFADHSIAQTKEVGGQGVIVWDIEGGEMPHAVTYLGDPRCLPWVAPEMDAIADEFFSKFRAAGLATGICIRPDNIVSNKEGKYPWIKGKYGHIDVSNPVEVLSEKIAYAKKRWGCTIFYMDTNFTPKMKDGKMVMKPKGGPDYRMLTSQEMAELHKLQPDVLIWPEFQQPDYFASVSGYGEYFRVSKITELAIAKYPKAFRVWMPRLQVPDIYESWDEFITNGVMKGEVFLFECSKNSDSMNAMEQLLKNAQDEAAFHAHPDNFHTVQGATALIAQLESEKSWVHRRILIEALAKDASPEAIAALARILQSEKDGLQWFAAWALGRQGTPAALEVLQSATKGTNEQKTPAIQGLAVSKRPEAASMLIPLLDNKGNPEIRWAVIDALGKLGNPEACPPLIDLLKSLEGSPANNTRDKTIRALGALGDSRAVPVLEAALKNPAYLRLRPVIQKALDKLGAGGNAKTSVSPRSK